MTQDDFEIHRKFDDLVESGYINPTADPTVRGLMFQIFAKGWATAILTAHQNTAEIEDIHRLRFTLVAMHGQVRRVLSDNAKRVGVNGKLIIYARPNKS